MRNRLAALALALAVVACDAPLELSVDARTDLPRGAYDAVSTSVMADGYAAGPIRRPIGPGEDLSTAVRVADLAGLPAGRTRVQVVLESAGAALLVRTVELALASDFALTVTLDAACVGVTCDGASSECVGGACVPPECGGGVPGACGDLSCRTDGECRGAVSGCAVAHCEHARCVCDVGALDGGPGDGGACECAAGAVEDEMRDCGCGVGTERRSRACDGCRWAAWDAWEGCAAPCSPDDVDEETRACGNCDAGTQRRTRTCDAACAWGAWSAWSTCSGGGVCAPGATRTGCDPCGHEVCRADCTWGACSPAPGGECLRIRPGTSGPPGNQYRCCGTDRWQFCLDTCMWSTECDACTECTC